MVAGNDITKEVYAHWLEDTIRQIQEFKPKQMVFVANNEEGEFITSYFHCNPYHLALMAGVLQQDSVLLRIEANQEWLKSVLKGNDEDEYREG